MLGCFVLKPRENKEVLNLELQENGSINWDTNDELSKNGVSPMTTNGQTWWTIGRGFWQKCQQCFLTAEYQGVGL